MLTSQTYYLSLVNNKQEGPQKLFSPSSSNKLLPPVRIISRQLPIFLGPFYKSLHGFQFALIIFFHIYSYLIGVVGESDS